MRVHSLKIQKEYLANLLNGSKKSEIRLNDRDYQQDDLLEFLMKKKPQKDIVYIIIL